MMNLKNINKDKMPRLTMSPLLLDVNMVKVLDC
jgi:hypothetical protein